MSFLTRDPARQRWSAALAATLRSMRQDVIAERLAIIATEDVSRELAALRIPVVIVHFAGDLVIGGDARAHLESVCHNADVVRAPGPHFAIETQPRESAAAIAPRLASMFGKPLTRTGT
jgi:pimeloyl-ACP methyl ester carboxylesterase